MHATDPRLPLPSNRFASLDIARSAALMAMIVYHFFWDLTALGFLAPDTMYSVYWRNFARLIAASFLFLSGMSLWLAHSQGIVWKPFLRRLMILVIAALAVSIATRIAFPAGWVRFGILHAIAASTVIGIAFLRLPLIVSLAAILVILALNFVDLPQFNSPWLIWTGLGREAPYMLDYEPLVPWLAACLAGIVTARVFNLENLAPRQASKNIRLLAWPGRHSLAIYLLHQPIIYGALYTVSWLRLA